MPDFSKNVGIAYRFLFLSCICMGIHQTFHAIKFAISVKSSAC